MLMAEITRAETSETEDPWPRGEMTPEMRS